MFIPIRTDRAPRYTPWMTQVLILGNILVYLYGFVSSRDSSVALNNFVDAGALKPTSFDAWNLISYQFLHDTGGISHLLFNMLFLWVFGSAVEGRLKHFGFLLFYLAGGVMAGFGHMMFSQASVIGASGSVTAVTGMYLALFPRSRVQLLCFFIIIGIFHIPSMWFIGIYFAADLIRALTGAQTGVAYQAHLAGSITGFTFGLILLATGVLPRTEFDAFYLLKQWRRRSQFRNVTHQSRGGVWDDPARKKPTKRPVRPLQPPKQRREDPEHARLRTELSEFIRNRDLEAAARRYRELLDEKTIVTLPLARQMDLANQLFAEGHHKAAATAYESALQAPGGRPDKTDVELMLGILYGRHLGDPSKAVVFLESALPHLHDESRRDIAQSILEEARQA